MAKEDFNEVSSSFETMQCIFPRATTTRSAVPGVSPSESTNSDRLFTPGERNALAKSKVHQISWAISLISQIWRIATEEWNKQDFNFQRQMFGKSFYIQQL